MKPTVSVTQIAAAVVRERARGRVERLEEPVLDGHVRAGERVQERRLADVRVAGERDCGGLRAAPRLAARVALAAELAEAPLEDRDPAPRQPAVRLELRLARSARADAAAQALEVLPHPAHPRQVVLELRELDLELALGADGVLREDVEDQLRAVDDAGLEGILEQALLGRAELVVDDEDVGGGGPESLLELVQLALADIAARVGTRTVLHDLVHGLDACGARELAQLRELFYLARWVGAPRRRARARARRPAPDRADVASQGDYAPTCPSPGERLAFVPVRVSSVLAAQATYPFVRIEQAKRAAAASGIEIVDFGPGDPREPTDPLIRQALVDALAETRGYPKAEGLPELRSAIAGWLERRFGVVRRSGDRDRAHVRQQGGDLQLRPGRGRSGEREGHRARDRARLPRARARALFAGARVVHLPLREDGGFLPDLDAIDRRYARADGAPLAQLPEQPDGCRGASLALRARRRARPGARLPAGVRRGVHGALVQRASSVGAPGRRPLEHRRLQHAQQALVDDRLPVGLRRRSALDRRTRYGRTGRPSAPLRRSSSSSHPWSRGATRRTWSAPGPSTV